MTDADLTRTTSSIDALLTRLTCGVSVHRVHGCEWFILQNIHSDCGRQMTAAKSLAISCQTLRNRLKTSGL
jgi:hypothetical protein